eukprot:gene4542-6412_t
MVMMEAIRIIMLVTLYISVSCSLFKDKKLERGKTTSSALPDMNSLSVDTGTKKSRNLNILVILADDLGYGDLSVQPFVGSGIFTPNLERMAANGVIMTNFHTAASTCTPTRASILTGLYPWRLGIKAVYEYGEKGKSNRDDWLPQVPTAATIFRDANYTTAHSGKWHLGGMRNDDIDMRRLPDLGDNVIGGKRCPHPGPNQQGFTHYVSVLDGPGAPRQNNLQVEDTLYSRGCDYLLYNDDRIGGADYNISGFLSYCEARHAIRMMKDSVKQNKPFYVHLWFHAPHGPWEEIPGYKNYYGKPSDASKLPLCANTNARYCKFKTGNTFKVTDRGLDRMSKFRTMVTDMDKQVGLVLDSLKEMNIDKNTLVVFLSDNGPEDFAGTSGGYRANKRYIYEGGIRVPAIFQWIGTIPGGRNISTFGVSTDLLPTFLDAAGVIPPTHVRLDGMSLLPELINKGKKRNRRHLAERVTFWHNDYEGPRRTAAWISDYKLFLDENELPFEMYDMRIDAHETHNLLSKSQYDNMRQKIQSKDSYLMNSIKNEPSINTLDIYKKRNDTGIHNGIMIRLFKVMKEYALFGDEAHRIYLKENNGRHYLPTIKSDNRPVRSNIYKLHSRQEVEELLKIFLKNNSCSTSCDCRPKSTLELASLPFSKTATNRLYLIPSGFLNGTLFLKI